MSNKVKYIKNDPSKDIDVKKKLTHRKNVKSICNSEFIFFEEIQQTLFTL